MGRRWTKDEVDRFSDVWESGKYSLKDMAAMFERGERALKVYASKLGLPSHRDCTAYITKQQITDAFGYDTKSIYSVFGTLKFRRKYNGKKLVYHVTPTSFWLWAYENRERVDFSRYTYGLIGDEPKWLANEMKIDKRKITRRLWLGEHDAVLRAMYYTNKTNQDIADRLDRTVVAIESRIRKLRRYGLL